MDDLISKRSAHERLIIAKTLLETVLQDMPTAEPELANNSPKVENGNGDLISRQAAIDALGEEPEVWVGADDEVAARGQWRIDKAAIEAVPTAEKKGEWLMIEDADEDGNARYECSLCHAGETHTPSVKVSYCWNCGAYMREESK